MKKILFGALAIAMTLALSMAMVSCGDKGGATKYDVTFDPGVDATIDGKAGAVTVSVEKDKTVGDKMPANPVKAGNDFRGWFDTDAATGGTEFKSDTPVTAKITVFARWTAETPPPSDNEWRVTFNAQSGSTVAAQNVTKGQAIATSPTTTRTGYTFDGWFTAATAGTIVVFPYTPTANVTLYAQWTAVSGDTHWTITFNAQGGSAVSSESVVKGEALATLPTTTRADYGFDGWFTAATAGTIVSAPYTPTADVTLYAQWTAVQGGGEDDGITTMSLNNGGFALFKFVLPSGKKWSDYNKLTVDYRVDQENMNMSTRSSPRLMGSYTEADFCQFVTLENPDGAGYRNYAFIDLNNPAGINGANLYNGPFIMDNNINGWPADADPDAWFTHEYKIDGSNPHGQFSGAPGNNQNLPAANAEGPFIFGIGFSGQDWAHQDNAPKEDGSIKQDIKEFVLTGTDGSKVYAQPVFEGWMAFVAYGPYQFASGNDNWLNAWVGSPDFGESLADDKPEYEDVTITFYENLDLADEVIEERVINKGGMIAGFSVNEGGTTAGGVLPNATASGYKLLGWAREADAEEPDADINNLTRFYEDTGLYGVWEEDNIPVRAAVTLTAEDDSLTFTGKGDFGTKEGAEFEFARTLYGSTIVYGFPAAYADYRGSFTVKFEISDIVGGSNHGADPAPMAKFSFGNDEGGYSGSLGYDDFGEGEHEKTFAMSALESGWFNMQHNDGGGDSSATYATFTIKIISVTFTDEN